MVANLHSDYQKLLSGVSNCSTGDMNVCCSESVGRHCSFGSILNLLLSKTDLNVIINVIETINLILYSIAIATILMHKGSNTSNI